MLKRILAWVLLVGFVFLICNILFLGFYRIQSVIIYIIIAFFFIVTNRKPNAGNTRFGGEPGSKMDNMDDSDDTSDKTGDKE